MCFKLLLAYLQPVVATPLRHLEECRGYFIGSKLTGSTVGNCLPRSVDRMIVRFGLSHVFLCMVTEAIASSSVLSFSAHFRSWEIPHYLCRMLLRPNSDWIVTDT